MSEAHDEERLVERARRGEWIADFALEYAGASRSESGVWNDRFEEPTMRSKKPAGELPRRDSLKVGLAAGLGTAGLGSSALEGAESGEATASIPMRKLGKTGLSLPILGFGGAALPSVWGNPLSTEDRVKLVRYAFDRGIRHFDTAGNCTESQPILGDGLKGIRDKVFLVTKVETTVAAEVRGAAEKSLQEPQTGFLDTVLIHGTPGIEQMTVEQAMKIHGVLAKLRDEGPRAPDGNRGHEGGVSEITATSKPIPMGQRTDGLTSEPSSSLPLGSSRGGLATMGGRGELLRGETAMSKMWTKLLTCFVLFAIGSSALGADERSSQRRPDRFAIIFNRGYAGDHLPSEPAAFERLIRGIRKAHINTVLCKYEDWRAAICKKHDVQIFVDLLAPGHHVYKEVESARKLCEGLRGDDVVYGYHIWSDNIGETYRGRSRDAAPGRVGVVNANRGGYTVATSIPFGLKGSLFHCAGGVVDEGTGALDTLGNDLQAVNARFAAIGEEVIALGNPTAVYSTPITKTEKDRPVEGYPVIPGGLASVPSDRRFRVTGGEVVPGVFEGPEGSTVLALASHNAYASQTVTLEFTSPVRIRLFDRASKRWTPSKPIHDTVSFRVEESATELVRTEL